MVRLMSAAGKVIHVVSSMAGIISAATAERLVLKWFIHAHVLRIQLLKAQRGVALRRLH